MSLRESASQFFVGKIAFPATNYFFNRKGISGGFRELLETERLSPDALKELQLQKLRAIVGRAYVHCPFYSKRLQQARLFPADIRSLEDLRRIPPLERREVIENRLDLVDSRYRESALAADRAGLVPGTVTPFAAFRKHHLVRNNTTGSTGTPTSFYEDGSTTALNWVHEQRLKSWYGLEPGVKEARMKLNSRMYAARPMQAFFREHLWNQIMLPGFFLSDAEYALALREIRRFRPRVLWGPTPSLTGLARYAQSVGENFFGEYPSLVISWAAPLYNHEKSFLGEVFRCPVSNIYGCRELGHVALMCPHGSHHVNEENYIVEVDSDSQNSTSSGEVLITPLYDTPMPFIRYRIGDLVELGGRGCSCGRSLRVIEKILGRVGEAFYTQDGYQILPNFWCHVFTSGRVGRDVERFQVVYRRADCIRFRIVPRSTYSEETEASLRGLLRTSFDANMRFEFERVPDIPPQPSGKTPFVVNEVQSAEQQLAHT